MAATGGTEQELEFQICSSYLTKRKISRDLQEVYVNNITRKAYHLYWRRTDGTYYGEWLEKKEFDDKYWIFELLREENVPPSLGEDKLKIEVNNPDYLKALTVACPVCNGMGTLPDESVTTGNTTCPKCWGSGRIHAVV